MNRSDLVTAIADRIGDKKKARQAVDALVEIITDAVARGEKVAVSGLGTFERAVRASSGESERSVAGVAVPKFEPTKGFQVLVEEARHLGEQAIAVAAGALADGEKAKSILRIATKAQTKAEKKYGDEARPVRLPSVVKPTVTSADADAPVAAATPPPSMRRAGPATRTTAGPGRTAARPAARKAAPRKATAPKTAVAEDDATPAPSAGTRTAASKTAASKTAASKTAASKTATPRKAAASKTATPRKAATSKTAASKTATPRKSAASKSATPAKAATQPRKEAAPTTSDSASASSSPQAPVEPSPDSPPQSS